MAAGNFNFLFHLWQAYENEDYPSPRDAFIINELKPYLRDGDVLNIVTGNGIEPGSDLGRARHDVKNPPYRFVDMKIVNERLARFGEALSGINIRYSVLTAGMDHLRLVIDCLSPAGRKQLDTVFYAYEPNFLLEFDFHGEASVRHLREAASLIRGAGFKAGAAPPTGCDLKETGFTNWNYGRFAQELDRMVLQTQASLAVDCRNRDLNLSNWKNYALNTMLKQFSDYPGSCCVFPQVTMGAAVGDEVPAASRSGYASDLLYCKSAVNALYESGFPGVSLWYNLDANANVLETVRKMRTTFL